MPDDLGLDRPGRQRELNARDSEEDRTGRPKRPGRELGEDSSTLAKVSLLLGFPSLCMAALAGIPALICAIIALNRRRNQGKAIAGLCLGIFGALIVPLVICLVLARVFHGAESCAKDQSHLKMMAVSAFWFNDDNHDAG